MLVPTFHWDREWHRTFEGFRARLIDQFEHVLAMLDDDPGYRFMLDGQTIVLEDFLAIRPDRRADVERFVADGRLTIGPWYVQPDCILPSGEALVRNLLEGRRVGSAFGPLSTIAYTPDSFGHPAQYPQLFAGFGLEGFAYWRGNGREVQALPREYRWVAPDGSGVVALHMEWAAPADLPSCGAPGPGDDLRDEYSWVPARAASVEAIVEELAGAVRELAAEQDTDHVLIIRGGDHVIPEVETDRIASELAAAVDGTVVRGSLEDFFALIGDELPEHRGELLQAISAPLLSGVWSTRTYLKLRNRACEAALEGWAEPWAALGRLLGGSDERPALRHAWRSLLENQAHDSICGCSADAVHRQMLGRYDAARELATETSTRSLERLAGLGPLRRTAWSDEVEIAVFNPSPHPRTDVVRVPLVSHPIWGPPERHPLMLASLSADGFTVDGAPARPVPADGRARVRRRPDDVARDVEFVAADVPPFGCRTFKLAPGPAADDLRDSGRVIAAGPLSVVADLTDGTLTVAFEGRTFAGLCALEDVGDRGDSFDFDPVPGAATLESVNVQRSRHVSGIASLRVVRRLAVPRLAADREGRADEYGHVTVTVVACVHPGARRVYLDVEVVNEATDHRLRMLFPTGAPVGSFAAATTFDTAIRSTAPVDDSGWQQAAEPTFPSQGWTAANGLSVMAPGLYETEVDPAGTIAVTLLRAVGWESRDDLRTRPISAGPALDTPEAQCLGATHARLALAFGADARDARDFELGLRAVVAGEEPLLEPGVGLLALEPRELLLSAVKPAQDGDGTIVRVLNPTDDEHVARLRTALPLAGAALVRLDESELELPVERDGDTLAFAVPPHAIRTLRIDCG